MALMVPICRAVAAAVAGACAWLTELTAGGSKLSAAAAATYTDRFALMVLSVSRSTRTGAPYLEILVSETRSD